MEIRCIKGNLISINHITLNNGVQMPMIGMGTFSINGLKLVLLVRKAVKMGYSSFDTASAYGNEKWLGRGIRFSGKSRAKLFITTKLSNRDQRSGNIRTAFQNSLLRLGMKYLDLYLMHWPNPETYLTSWKQIETLYKERLIRAIGVCNFHISHLESLLEIADVVPAVNQIELHPLLSQTNLVKFCIKYGIKITAYSPLARMNDKLINNEVLIDIAKKYKKTVPQIILRWDYQRQIISIPKSSNPVRLKQNISIFDFSLLEDEINLINKVNINFRIRHNPDNCDFSKL